MKINGLKDKPIWHEIKCICKHDLEHKFPFVDCTFCKYKQSEDSLPKEDFYTEDKKGKQHLISEITIVRGKHDDIIGWTF
ncbi:MAG: hypothetical protein ABGY11_05245 [Candidatus Thioglobus sp.]|jgi:hypothetical protein